MVDCNSQTDRIILTWSSNQLHGNWRKWISDRHKTTVNCEVQTEIKNTAHCEVQTELNSENIHCVDKLEIVKSMESFPTQTDPNKLLMMSPFHQTPQSRIQSPLFGDNVLEVDFIISNSSRNEDPISKKVRDLFSFHPLTEQILFPSSTMEYFHE